MWQKQCLFAAAIFPPAACCLFAAPRLWHAPAMMPLMAASAKSFRCHGVGPPSRRRPSTPVAAAFAIWLYYALKAV